MRERSKDENEDFMSNVSDHGDSNDDEDGIFRLSHSHSSLSSLDSDMTGRTDGTRKIQKVVRDVIKRDFKSFGNKSFQVRKFFSNFYQTLKSIYYLIYFHSFF